MEVFDVHTCGDNKIVLKSEKQMETLFNQIKDSADVMIRWEDDDEGTKNSKILITDGLMSRIKDGRFIISSEEYDEE